MGGKHPIFAALYDQLLSVAERKSLRQKRAELLGPLQGHVLEIGAGTGLNLLHYKDVSRLTLLEPDPAMESRLRGRIAAVAPPYPIDVLTKRSRGSLVAARWQRRCGGFNPSPVHGPGYCGCPG
jgi:hypothetical protein